MNREDRIRQAQGARLKEARVAAGYRSARDAALSNEWPESTYRAHEGGTRTIGQDDAERYARRFRALGVEVSAQSILFGVTADEPATVESGVVPIMGRIGAGAEILPEFEQVPPEGLWEVELPFAVPDDVIGLEVHGDSMLPRYDPGDVIIVYREQRRTLETFFGEEAAVRTDHGRRFLKRIVRGFEPKTVNLESFNATTIESVRLEWVGEIWITVRAGQIRRLNQNERVLARRRAARRARETEGMDELPLK